jgi:benzoyl-CoA-dihydrodiol lyase
METIDFQRDPASYLHWKLSVDGPVAKLVMEVQEERPWRPGYPLKLNSYDLGVDMELADAIQRLRFERPEVRVLEITSTRDKIFCTRSRSTSASTPTRRASVSRSSRASRACAPSPR